MGEAKAGERLTTVHVDQLEVARDALQERGRGAQLLLFGAGFWHDVRREAGRRRDLEVVDLQRLYTGE